MTFLLEKVISHRLKQESGISRSVADGNCHSVSMHPPISPASIETVSKPGHDSKEGASLFVESLEYYYGFYNHNTTLYRKLHDALNRLLESAGIDPKDYKLDIVNIDQVNAFVLLDIKHVVINWGLIKKFSNRRGTVSIDELAAILAHEIGHGILGEFKGRTIDDNSDFSKGVEAMKQRVYRLDAEERADRLGLFLLNKAGFNPEALPRAFTKLGTKKETDTDELTTNIPFPASILMSHPPLFDRIAATKRRFERYLFRNIGKQEERIRVDSFKIKRGKVAWVEIMMRFRRNGVDIDQLRSVWQVSDVLAGGAYKRKGEIPAIIERGISLARRYTKRLSPQEKKLYYWFAFYRHINKDVDDVSNDGDSINLDELLCLPSIALDAERSPISFFETFEGKTRLWDVMDKENKLAEKIVKDLLQRLNTSDGTIESLVSQLRDFAIKYEKAYKEKNLDKMHLSGDDYDLLDPTILFKKVIFELLKSQEENRNFVLLCKTLFKDEELSKYLDGIRIEKLIDSKRPSFSIDEQIELFNIFFSPQRIAEWNKKHSIPLDKSLKELSSVFSYKEFPLDFKIEILKRFDEPYLYLEIFFDSKEFVCSSEVLIGLLRDVLVNKQYEKSSDNEKLQDIVNLLRGELNLEGITTIERLLELVNSQLVDPISGNRFSFTRVFDLIVLIEVFKKLSKTENRERDIKMIFEHLLGCRASPSILVGFVIAEGLSLDEIKELQQDVKKRALEEESSDRRKWLEEANDLLVCHIIEKYIKEIGVDDAVEYVIENALQERTRNYLFRKIIEYQYYNVGINGVANLFWRMQAHICSEDMQARVKSMRGEELTGLVGMAMTSGLEYMDESDLLGDINYNAMLISNIASKAIGIPVTGTVQERIGRILELFPAPSRSRDRCLLNLLGAASADECPKIRELVLSPDYVAEYCEAGLRKDLEAVSNISPEDHLGLILKHYPLPSRYRDEVIDQMLQASEFNEGFIEHCRTFLYDENPWILDQETVPLQVAVRIEMINHIRKMPLQKKLDLLKEWVEEGANLTGVEGFVSLQDRVEILEHILGGSRGLLTATDSHCRENTLSLIGDALRKHISNGLDEEDQGDQEDREEGKGDVDMQALEGWLDFHDGRRETERTASFGSPYFDEGFDDEDYAYSQGLDFADEQSFETSSGTTSYRAKVDHDEETGTRPGMSDSDRAIEIFKIVLAQYPRDRQARVVAEFFAKLATKRESSMEEIAAIFFETLGTVSIKTGQFLSTLGLLPRELRKALSRLTTNVSPMTVFEVWHNLQQIYDSDVLSRHFSRIGPCKGSASVKQTFVVRNEKGERKVFKMRKPWTRENIDLDLLALRKVVESLNVQNHIIGGMRLPESVISEVGEVVREEVLETTDIENQAKFRERLNGREVGQYTVMVPEIDHDLTGPYVVVESFCPGVTYHEMMGQAGDAAERLKLPLLLLNLGMILNDGDYHADPHPGNVIIDEEDSTIGVVDFGMVGELDNRNRTLFLKFLSILTTEKYIEAIALLLQMHQNERGSLEGLNLELIVQSFLEYVKYFKSSDEGFDSKALNLLTMLDDLGVSIPKQIYHLIKTLGQLGYLLDRVETNSVLSLLHGLDDEDEEIEVDPGIIEMLESVMPKKSNQVLFPPNISIRIEGRPERTGVVVEEVLITPDRVKARELISFVVSIDDEEVTFRFPPDSNRYEVYMGGKWVGVGDYIKSVLG